MNQRTLFPGTPLPPSSGSATSQAAARAVACKSERWRQDILAYIREHGEHGATDHEIQRDFRLSGDVERARRWELCGGKHHSERPVLIIDSGRTRPTASGKQAIVWVIA